MDNSALFVVARFSERMCVFRYITSHGEYSANSLKNTNMLPPVLSFFLQKIKAHPIDGMGRFRLIND